MFNSPKIVRQTCKNCGYEWPVASGGYGKSLKTDDERILFEAESYARLCPRCQRTAKTKEMVAAAKMDENKSMDKKEEPIKTYKAKKPRFTLEDGVFLTAKARLQLDEAITKITFHKQIYEEWNFKSVDKSGKGLLLNFYGKPGTGKTRTAEALAGTLGLDIISLGMSDVESKFMGDTSKNIEAAFKCATEENAVLFFDEADTLLGKRLSSVTQGIDNEVNSMRSAMLVELERFEGIVIFASNFVENYDKAFESRITQNILFEMPDTETRRKLWNFFLVPEIPLADERESLLSKLADNSSDFSGRNRRNCRRLALPKALHEANVAKVSPSLGWKHLEEAIVEVQTANKIVGSVVNPGSRTTPEENRMALHTLSSKIKPGV